MLRVVSRPGGDDARLSFLVVVVVVIVRRRQSRRRRRLLHRKTTRRTKVTLKALSRDTTALDGGSRRKEGVFLFFDFF